MGYTLRVSVLEHCQLRCNYCLPPQNSYFRPKKNWISVAHYEKIAQALLPIGIEKVRFTGGEPLLRGDLPAIVSVFSQTLKSHIALTTNGLRFSLMKDALVASGLEAITFHLDTLREDRYARIMGAGSVGVVLDALHDAQSSDLLVKVNVVIQRGVNEDELIDFLMLAKEICFEVRFIEMMNTGSAVDYVSEKFISGQEILELIAKETAVVSLGRSSVTAPAEEFLATDLSVKFGLIASDTRPFCNHCNRLRLSADGRLRTCLYEPEGHSLKSNGRLYEELEQRVLSIIAKKTSYHPSLRKIRKDFSMSQIGG